MDTLDLKEAVREYWNTNPNAAAIGAGIDPQSRSFYETIEKHRYQAEPCIREMAEFDRWRGKRVLEVGCGIGTDLRQFASAGALVVGIDLTLNGITMARRGFKLFGLQGCFVVADAEALPFLPESFDLVYSNGVIHHTPDTDASVREIYRVVRSGGEARVMVYHRNSYFRKVVVGMIVSPILRVLTIMFPSGKLPTLLRNMIPQGLHDMYVILSEKGYSHDRVFTLCTDPSRPGQGNANPLARSYSRKQAAGLFASFQAVQTFVRQLYYADFLPSFVHNWMERRYGWFLFIRATK